MRCDFVQAGRYLQSLVIIVYLPMQRLAQKTLRTDHNFKVGVPNYVQTQDGGTKLAAETIIKANSLSIAVSIHF